MRGGDGAFVDVGAIGVRREVSKGGSRCSTSRHFHPVRAPSGLCWTVPMNPRRVVMAVAVVVAGLQLGLPAHARSEDPHGRITRPVSDLCSPDVAFKVIVPGAGVSVPPTDGEVFADPAAGASGPFAVAGRIPMPGTTWADSGRIQNATVAGQPATLTPIAEGRGGIDWLTSNGDLVLLRTKDLAEAEVLELAESVDAGTANLPAGLVSIGIARTDRTATVRTTECRVEQLWVGAVSGPVPNRYAATLFQTPVGAQVWDYGDTTLFVYGPPEAMPATRPVLSQVPKRTWKKLLAVAQHAAEERSAGGDSSAP